MEKIYPEGPTSPLFGEDLLDERGRIPGVPDVAPMRLVRPTQLPLPPDIDALLRTPIVASIVVIPPQSLVERSLVEIVERGFEDMTQALSAHGISLEGVPSLDAFMKPNAISPDLLNRVTRTMKKPSFILEPPGSRHDLLNALRRVPDVDLSWIETHTNDFENDDFWNDGEEENTADWRASIVEGVPDLDFLPSVSFGNFFDPFFNLEDPGSPEMRTPLQIIAELKKRFAEAGIGVMSGTKPYLSLVMKSMAQGAPVDRNSRTVINAASASSDRLLAIGESVVGGIDFSLRNPTMPDPSCGIRSAVSLPI